MQFKAQFGQKLISRYSSLNEARPKGGAQCFSVKVSYLQQVAQG